MKKGPEFWAFRIDLYQRALPSARQSEPQPMGGFFMTTIEFAYLCLTIGCFIVFAVGLAGAVAYSNGKPKQQDAVDARKSAHA
jgi:hypothetical protein